MKNLKTLFATALTVLFACTSIAQPPQGITVGFDEQHQRIHTVFYSDVPCTIWMEYDYSGACGDIEYYDFETQSYEANNTFELGYKYDGDGNIIGVEKAWCTATLEPMGLNDGDVMTFSATAHIMEGSREVAIVGPFQDQLVARVDADRTEGDYEYAQGCAGLDLPEIIDIGQSYCATLCHGTYTIPVYCESIGYTPDLMEITIQNGCSFDTECNSSDCEGLDEFDWNLQTEILIYEFGGECYIFLLLDYCGTDEGCICISRGDFILPVQLNSFDAVAADSRVLLNWNTSSETDMDHFAVVRDGEVVAEIDATNSPSGHSYGWIDNDVVNGVTYRYTLRSVDLSGAANDLTTESATPVEAATPIAYELKQNYPNPFNSETTFSFSIPVAQHVTLKVFDVLGREVATVLDREMSANTHTVNWSASGLSAGVYMYTLTAGDFSKTAKMLYLK